MFAQAQDGMNYLSSVPEVTINWWAILAATAVAMAIGSVWYGPLFGDKWLKLVHLTKKETAKDWKTPMLAMLIFAFIQSFVVAHLVVYSAYFYETLSELNVGLMTGFWLWVGIALPLIISSNMFARRPIELTYVEAGNQLLTLLAVASILAVWN